MAKTNTDIITHQTCTAELRGILQGIGRTHGLYQVFSDFVAMGAIAFSNRVDLVNYEKREAEYMQLVKRYSKDEARLLASGLAWVVNGLECGATDLLGALYMSLDLGDAWKGQFFSPLHICVLMAELVLHNTKLLDSQEFITFCDPCVGGGAMPIAYADVMKKQGFNYQQQAHFVAVDVDIKAVHMAYLQLSLLHIPAVIYHGNSLSNQYFSEWKTPAHVLGGWDRKLKCREAADELMMTLKAASKNNSDVLTEAKAENDVQMPYLIKTAINIKDQLALF